MSLIGETIFLPGMTVPGSPISAGTSTASGGLNGAGLLGGLGPAIIGGIAAGVLPSLFDEIFGGGPGISGGRVPLPQRPQGEITNPTKIGTFEETYGAPPPGFVYDEQGFLRSTSPTDNGYYINAGGNPVATTAPLVPVPKPTAPASGGGGGSPAEDPNAGADDGFVDIGIDPDLTGGDLGGIGTGGGGPTEMDKPPTEYTNAEWADIIDNWFIRFPNASRDEAIAAAQSVNAPGNLVNEAIDARYPKPTPDAASPFGSGSVASGDASGGASGCAGGYTGGAGGTTGSGATGGTGSAGSGSSGSTGGSGGTGTGTGSGTSAGAFNAMGLLSPTRTTDLVFGDMWQMKDINTPLIQNLLTYRPNRGMFG